MCKLVLRVLSSLALLGGEPELPHTPDFIWPPISERDAQLVAEMVRRGELSYYGREGQVEILEEKFRAYLNAKYCLATSSGTAALHSAFFGLGLSPGDEVLAPTYTFLATVMPLFVTNAVPVLVDAESTTGNLDPSDVERRITRRTRAIVVTHNWGNPVNMPKILEIARRHDLRVVEDCSHAHGAICAGRKVGTFGDVSVFSLQGKKLVAAGQGGILVTNDWEIFERAVLLGHFNVRSLQEVHSSKYRPYAYTGFGLNYRMHPLAAAIANNQMDRLETYIAGRLSNLDYFSERIANVPGIHPPITGSHVTRQVYYSYKPRYRPEELGGLPIETYVAAVRAEGMPIEHYDMPPLHYLPMFQDQSPPLRTHGVPEAFVNGAERRKYQEGDFPGSEEYAKNLLSLPPYTVPAQHLLDKFAGVLEKVARHADELLHEVTKEGFRRFAMPNAELESAKDCNS